MHYTFSDAFLIYLHQRYALGQVGMVFFSVGFHPGKPRGGDDLVADYLTMEQVARDYMVVGGSLPDQTWKKIKFEGKPANIIEDDSKCFFQIYKE